MPKRERDDAVAELSTAFFTEMLQEILMDVVQQTHQEAARTRAVCDVCHTRCVLPLRLPAPFRKAGSSRVPTPHTEAKGDGASPATNGANTPANGKDGPVLLECVECKRQIASNRYAPHLSSCMGIGNRRGAARNASVKSKLGSELAKMGSPVLGAEMQIRRKSLLSPHRRRASRKPRKLVNDILNVNGKRTASPSVSPVKKSKKQKTTGSPAAAARVKLDPDSPATSNNLLPTSAKVPSKLRASSTVSSLHREQRSSSPESATRLSSPAQSISTQTSAVVRSPAISSATLKSKQANGKGRAAPAPRIPSPPRPVPIIRMPEAAGYIVDVEGDETGSSTDTDSD
ncbi:uncharacterized protein BXZ73DRAFT_51499 [Epithele typhae]|uniref:uncharacterized protein n=1 Tax=Epithele typhae TaxID=378194 RepID=UPI0020086B2B|nr:uncharacterized protein BXZ73DRAFT_51499 [Epithele typhae]KAH9921971.1 hypothetical protein BXZ73DRAFT_51499 [Epithele typhae]